jgi:hypothetical protein
MRQSAQNEEAPTPKMLAGVNVDIETEEDATVRPCKPPQAVDDSTSNGMTTPTANQLAGVYLHVEAPEDLTVRLATSAPAKQA